MRYFYWIFLFFLFLYAGQVAAHHGTVQERVTLTLTDTSLPEGPNPTNWDKNDKSKRTYTRSGAKSWTLTLDLNLDTQHHYYRIHASLDRSDLDGFCANFGDNSYKDLEFLKSDYETKDANGNTTFPYVWDWRGDTELRHVITSANRGAGVPNEIIVRCHDWGAYGTVKVVVERERWNLLGVRFWDEVDTVTRNVPKDENNNGVDANGNPNPPGNGIADSWEGDGSKSHVVGGVTKGGYNPVADDEDVPQGTPVKGDGWPAADEYRGAFLQPTDTTITRLDPSKKDVMICSESALSGYSADNFTYIDAQGNSQQVSIPHHEFATIHESFVKKPWGAVHDTKDPSTLKKKISQDIGWVNFNSRYSDQRAWAIRVTTSTALARGFGDAAIGSPSYKSKARIYTNKIHQYVRQTFDNFQINTKDTTGNYTSEYLAAMDVVIDVTIPHEIGHSLALEHCQHANCLMRPGEEFDYDFDPKTKVLSHDVTVIDGGHDTEYAATRVINDRISFCGTCGEIHPAEEEANTEDNEEDTGGTPTPESPGTPTRSYTLVSSDGIYTAEAGTGHEANFTTSEAYSSVYWYVKTPSDTSSLGTHVKTDTGDSSTTKTAQLSYSFPSGVSGDYVITAYVYPPAGGSVYQTSYTVSVSLPFSPGFSVDATSYSTGDTITGTVTANVPLFGCTLKASPPGSPSDVYYSYFAWGSAWDNTVSVRFTFPENEPLGEWTIWLEASPWSQPNRRVFSQHYTVTVK